MGEGVNPPVLGGAPFPVGNNSMPPVAYPRLGTSGCDYTGRIEFDKKPVKNFIYIFPHRILIYGIMPVFGQIARKSCREKDRVRA